MQLGAAKRRAPAPIILTDALNVSYDFDAYPIRQNASAENAVFAFAHEEHSEWALHFVGAATSLTVELPRDVRRSSAIEAGATHLLVHVPDFHGEIGHKEAAMRIAHAYKPYMNGNYRTRFSSR